MLRDPPSTRHKRTVLVPLMKQSLSVNYLADHTVRKVGSPRTKDIAQARTLFSESLEDFPFMLH